MSRPRGEELEARLRATMKKELRRAMATTRSLLPADARRARDAARTSLLEAVPAVREATVVAGYLAVRGEADPAALLEAALARGARVALPTVDLASGDIVWRRRDASTELVYGPFGILEPPADAEPIDPASIDLVLVPGTAFDPRGGRLGMGKGFYDRALPAMSRALRIGIAFDFQVVDELPLEPHDVAMQLIATDAALIDLR